MSRLHRGSRAFFRPRDARFWAYAAVLASALFWRGPGELAGTGTILLCAVLTCLGAAPVAAFSWALDPHATLPRSFLAAGFGWGAASAVLLAATDRDIDQLLGKVLGPDRGGSLARWAVEPAAHDVLAMLGLLLLLSFAGERAPRPTDGAKLGISCGLGLWSGGLLLSLAQEAAVLGTTGLLDSLSAALPSWCALAAAPWAAPAAAGYGFGRARAETGAVSRFPALRRLSLLTAAALGSVALACLFDGTARAALASHASGWSWLCAAAAGFSLSFALLLPRLRPAWWAALGLGAASLVLLLLSVPPWSLVLVAVLSPLALLCFWHGAVRAEGSWLGAALAEEDEEIRACCTSPEEITSPHARRAVQSATRVALGPTARRLSAQLRESQIQLANSLVLLQHEREAAGAEPDEHWQAWLAQVAEQVEEHRAAVRSVRADMAREDGIYQ